MKDVAYVKNVTAYYRQKLDAIFKRRKEYIRASSARSAGFSSAIGQEFQQGLYRLFPARTYTDIFSFHTPKSLGEEMGVVKEVRGNYFTVAGVKPFSNGDGLCYLDEAGKLHGFG